MNSDTQIIKGILEGCILGLIARAEMYGYRTVEALNEAGFEVNEATVYPILARLESKGHVKVEKRPSPLGPARKYFSLTREGEQSLRDFLESWKRTVESVGIILEGQEYDKA